MDSRRGAWYAQLESIGRISSVRTAGVAAQVSDLWVVVGDILPAVPNPQQLFWLDRATRSRGLDTSLFFGSLGEASRPRGTLHRPICRLPGTWMGATRRRVRFALRIFDSRRSQLEVADVALETHRGWDWLGHGESLTQRAWVCSRVPHTLVCPQFRAGELQSSRKQPVGNPAMLEAGREGLSKSGLHWTTQTDRTNPGSEFPPAPGRSRSKFRKKKARGAGLVLHPPSVPSGTAQLRLRCWSLLGNFIGSTAQLRIWRVRGCARPGRQGKDGRGTRYCTSLYSVLCTSTLGCTQRYRSVPNSVFSSPRSLAPSTPVGDRSPASAPWAQCTFQARQPLAHHQSSATRRRRTDSYGELCSSRCRGCRGCRQCRGRVQKCRGAVRRRRRRRRCRRCRPGFLPGKCSRALLLHTKCAVCRRRRLRARADQRQAGKSLLFQVGRVDCLPAPARASSALAIPEVLSRPFVVTGPLSLSLSLALPPVSPLLSLSLCLSACVSLHAPALRPARPLPCRRVPGCRRGPPSSISNPQRLCAPLSALSLLNWSTPTHPHHPPPPPPGKPFLALLSCPGPHLLLTSPSLSPVLPPPPNISPPRRLPSSRPPRLQSFLW